MQVIQPWMVASDLVNLWLAGFRNADELKAMIQPDLLSH